MKREEIVEAIYGAIIKEGQRWNGLTGKEIRTGPPLDYLLAEAALTAIEARGLAVVPVVATAKMCGAAFDLGRATNHSDFADAWTAMLSASKTPDSD